MTSNNFTMLFLLTLLMWNVNGITNDTTEQPLQECTFDITLTDIGNPTIIDCPNRRERNNKTDHNEHGTINGYNNKEHHNRNKNKNSDENKNSHENGKQSKDYNRKDKDKDNDKKSKELKSYSDSWDDNSKNQNKKDKRKKKRFITTCLRYTISGMPNINPFIFLPLCPQTNLHGITEIEASDISQLITDDTFKNDSNVENAIGYFYNDKLGILLQLLDETAGAFKLCLKNIKQQNMIEKISISEGIVWINSTDGRTECAVHGLPCFKFKFKDTCKGDNITGSTNDEIQGENALLSDDKDSDTFALNSISGVRLISLIGLVILVLFLGVAVAYWIYVCKGKQSDVYDSALADENEIELGEVDNTDIEGEILVN